MVESNQLSERQITLTICVLMQIAAIFLIWWYIDNHHPWPDWTEVHLVVVPQLDQSRENLRSDGDSLEFHRGLAGVGEHLSLLTSQ